MDKMQFPTTDPPIKESFTLEIPDSADWIAPVRGALLDLVESWTFDETKVDIATVTQEYLNTAISLSKGVPAHNHDELYSPINHSHSRFEIWDSRSADIGLGPLRPLNFDRLRWRSGDALTDESFGFPYLLESGWYWVEVYAVIKCPVVGIQFMQIGESFSNINPIQPAKYINNYYCPVVNTHTPYVGAGLGYANEAMTLGIAMAHTLNPWPLHVRGHGWYKITKL